MDPTVPGPVRVLVVATVLLLSARMVWVWLVGTTSVSGDLRAEVRATAPVGSSRAQLYAVLRERRLLGFNYALRHFDISRSGGLADADHGEWPRPGQTPQPIADPRLRAFVARERRSLDTAHPFVDVIDTWDLQGFSCTTRARQRFFFDAHDRISRIEEPAPVRACD